eukprot:5625640-Heterocapsa_arctica.AAC.2
MHGFTPSRLRILCDSGGCWFSSFCGFAPVARLSPLLAGSPMFTRSVSVASFSYSLRQVGER